MKKKTKKMVQDQTVKCNAREWTKDKPSRDGWYFWKWNKSIKRQEKFTPYFIKVGQILPDSAGYWYGPIGPDA